MNMSDYQVEGDASLAAEYADEISCAGWIPTLALQSYATTTTEKQDTMPVELLNANVDDFLKKMYLYQYAEYPS